MKERVWIGAGIFVLLTVIPRPAFAHDTWLLPERGFVSSGTLLALDLTSGMAFPALDSAIDPDRIKQAVCRLGGKSSGVVQLVKSGHSMRLTARLDVAGIATISVDLKPKAIELNPDQVKEYLDEIGAPESIRQAWGGASGQTLWRETYTKHSKTFVRVGEPETDRSWAEPVGTALEFVPEENPTMLRVGDEFTVRVLKRGSPVGGFAVGIVHEGDATGILRTTDAQGRFTIHLDRPGRWLLRGTDLRRSSTADAGWESDFTTLTIEVRPR